MVTCTLSVALTPLPVTVRVTSVTPATPLAVQVMLVARAPQVSWSRPVLVGVQDRYCWSNWMLTVASLHPARPSTTPVMMVLPLGVMVEGVAVKVYVGVAPLSVPINTSSVQLVSSTVPLVKVKSKSSS